MTCQEMFDKVAEHLHKQRAQCRELVAGSADIFNCVYCNKEGMACAIGCLIPDGKMHLVQNNSGLCSNTEVRDILGIPSGSREYRFASALQNIHDCSKPDQWPERLLHLSNESNLTPPDFLYTWRKEMKEAAPAS